MKQFLKGTISMVIGYAGALLLAEQVDRMMSRHDKTQRMDKQLVRLENRVNELQNELIKRDMELTSPILFACRIYQTIGTGRKGIYEPWHKFRRQIYTMVSRSSERNRR